MELFASTETLPMYTPVSVTGVMEESQCVFIGGLLSFSFLSYHSGVNPRDPSLRTQVLDDCNRQPLVA